MAELETIESLPSREFLDIAERLVSAQELGSPPPLTVEQLEHLASASRDALTRDEQTQFSQLVAWVDANHTALFAAFPGPLPPFDHLRDFWLNFYEGPPGADDVPSPQTHALPQRFLDFELSFPLGVPACALTPHSQFIDYFARRGFDLLTYKTVRERPWNPHPFPQWGFAPDIRNALDLTDIRRALTGDIAPITGTLAPPSDIDPRHISLVNSFGVPSLPMEQWAADIDAAKRTLGDGQVLIVSVMGSPDASSDPSEVVHQFSTAAERASEAGADIIEVNLSCPNTGGQGVMCRDVEMSGRVVEAVRSSSSKPLLVKLSYLEQPLLKDLLTRCRNDIDGVVAINTVSVPARTSSGEPFFSNRPTGGLSGVGIRDAGLDMATRLVALREEIKKTSEWVIVGVGGVTTPEDYETYKNVGVDAVQSCSGAWMNPDLATDTRQQFGRRTSRSTLANILQAFASGGLSLVGGKPTPADPVD